MALSLLGIMQGRLVPPEPGRFQAFPRAHWTDEFSFAAQVPLDFIEWIVDRYGADINPILTDAGADDLRRLSRQSGVRIRSLCADYFMDFPFVRCSPAQCETRENFLKNLVGRAGQLGITRIVLPFVDASHMETAEDRQRVSAVLCDAAPFAHRKNVELHLETDLGPSDFATFLDAVPCENVKVNYDSGNSASLGYKVEDEFGAYGGRIGSVHVKDRVLGGSTVPLGAGNADFPALFSEMRRIGYQGDITLQVARSEPGNEVSWAIANRAFVAHHWALD